jgi:pimeloyl-ACP methyl ester carboxylesterase
MTTGISGAANFEQCELAFDLAGHGPPVIFIQGVGVCGTGWLPQVQALSPRFQCLTFDNRGLGRSQPLGRPLTVRQMARDALHLMSHVGWESAHIVGHSLGGPISLQIAFDAPERVRSLALLCTVARGRDATRLSARLLKLGLLSRIGTRRSRRRAFLQIVMPEAALKGQDPAVLAQELEPLFGHDIAYQPPVTMKQVRALRAFDATAALRRLAPVPTLVASAEHDPIAPPQLGRALAAAIPSARYEEFPGASHGVTIHCSERVNTLLSNHLAAAEVEWRDRQLSGPGVTG